MKLDKNAIMEIIPHRDPMLLVDEITELIPGEKAVGSFYVDGSREIFKGHFPGEPVLPGVYTVEACTQVADILLLSTERYKGTIPLFLGINNVKFIKKVSPGDTIEMHAEILKERPEKAIATCLVKAYVNGEQVAETESTLAMR